MQRRVTMSAEKVTMSADKGVEVTIVALYQIMHKPYVESRSS